MAPVFHNIASDEAFDFWYPIWDAGLQIYGADTGDKVRTANGRASASPEIAEPIAGGMR